VNPILGCHALRATFLLALTMTGPLLHGQDQAARALLERHLAWRKDATAAKVTNLVATARLQAGGLDGTVHVVLARDGRGREDTVLGLENTAIGSDARGTWLLNSSGQVGELAPNESAMRTREQQRRWFGQWPAEALAQATTRGQETIEGVTGEVVVVPLAGGSPVELVLGGDGELLAQRTHRLGIETTIRYGDWRAVGGIRLPFREQTVGGHDDRLLLWQTIEAPAAVADTALQRPLHQALGSLVIGHDHATIPLQASASGHWFMQVTIAGKQFQALLDTGAGATILDDGTAEQLGVAAAGEFRSFGAGTKGTAMHHGGAVTVELGDARLPVHTHVSDLSALGKALMHETDLIVGHELLLAFTMQLDQKSKTITLADPAQCKPAAGAVVLPCYSSTGGQVAVQATVEALPPDWFLVDTGAPPSVLLNGPYVRDHELLADRKGLHDLQLGGIDGHVPAKIGRLATFTFAGKTRDRTNAIFSCADQGAMAIAEYAGIIGNGILQHYRITFDLLGNRMVLEPPAEREDK